jgi:hypothetical protein
VKRAAAKVAGEIADYLESDGLILPHDTLRRWLLLLAPPGKRKAPARAKARPAAPSVATLDALCREIVFLRDGEKCRKCGRSDRQLQWCHVFSRRYKWVRWDMAGSFVGCAHCHLNWWHANLDQAMEWWRSCIGDAAFEALTLRAAKPRKVDLNLVKSYLEAEKRKL